MDMDILLLLIPVAFYVGWKANEAWMLLTFRTLLTDLNVSKTDLRRIAADKGIELTEPEQEDPDAPELEQLEVRIEQVGDQLLAYRKDTEEFLGQGQDRDTLIKRLTENLTNVRVIVAKEDGADLITVDPK